MTPVTHFIQYFENTPPDKTPFRQALYYYLKFFCSPLQPLNSRVLRGFYLQVLVDPYWQSRVQALSHSLRQEVRVFFRSSGFSEGEGEDVCGSLPVGQVVPIQGPGELQNLVKSFALKKADRKDQVRTLVLSPRRVLLLILKATGELEVLSHAPFALLEGGTLHPLAPLTHLHYTKSLHLQTDTDQQVESRSCDRLCRFRVNAQGRFEGSFHTLPLLRVQKVFHPEVPGPGSVLFTSLKFMESFFISPFTDSHYQSLIQKLYGQYQKMLTGRVAPLEVQNILKQARQALKDLYPSNHLLMLLIVNMEYHTKKVVFDLDLRGRGKSQKLLNPQGHRAAGFTSDLRAGVPL